MRATSICVAAITMALGCNGEDDSAHSVVAPGQECAPGTWPRADGSCAPAGLPPEMACPPGEWQRDDGACIPAGVPPDGCAAGFVHDGDRGCEPVLPATACAEGLMAVPGEISCREVAPCAPGTWGDIPVEPNTEYVDASYPEMDSDGSVLKPWTRIQAAVDAAASGAIVAVAAGSYLENVTVSGKAVRVWGVCPALVEVAGNATPSTILVIGAEDGTEVRELAVRGDAAGVVVVDTDVLLDRIWVHDNAGRGVNVQEGSGPSSLIVRASLLEQNRELGLFVGGSQATLEASVIRATAAVAGTSRGIGVQADETTGAPATLVARGSLVEQHREFGVFVGASDVRLEGSVVRNTLPNSIGYFGRGVNAQADPVTAAPAKVSLSQSLVEQSHDVGVFVAGAEVSVEGTVVRTTRPGPPGFASSGLQARKDPATGVPSVLELRTSLVEQNYNIGVIAYGSQATIDATVVRLTEPDAQELYGRGVSVHPDTGTRSTLAVRHSLIDQNHDIGLMASSSDATVEASVVRATQPVHGNGGRGLHMQPNPSLGTPSTLLLHASLVEQAHVAGVFIVGSSATIDACLLRETLPNDFGAYGDGVLVTAFESSAAIANVVATRIDGSARAAVSAHGAHVALGGSALSCQAFDLDYEPRYGVAARFEDLGGNLCGCPEATGACKAVSAGLSPPPPEEEVAE